MNSHGQAPLVHRSAPDMDAFFRTRDGRFAGGWTQPSDPRRAADELRVHHHEVTFDQPSRRPAYTPRFGDLVAAFPSPDFLFDSETELGRHHFEYRADPWSGATRR